MNLKKIVFTLVFTFAISAMGYAQNESLDLTFGPSGYGSIAGDVVKHFEAQFHRDANLRPLPGLFFDFEGKYFVEGNEPDKNYDDYYYGLEYVNHGYSYDINMVLLLDEKIPYARTASISCTTVVKVACFIDHAEDLIVKGKMASVLFNSIDDHRGTPHLYTITESTNDAGKRRLSLDMGKGDMVCDSADAEKDMVCKIIRK